MEEPLIIDASNRPLDFPDDLEEDEEQLKQGGRWTTPNPMQISGTKSATDARERQSTRKPMKSGEGEFFGFFL
jgi:hypothetical protein